MSARATPGTETPALALHRWRRVDWRYLLPAGPFGRLAVAGPLDDELGAALPLLAAEVHEVVSPAGWGALRDSCDLVVLVRPTRADLRLAIAAARPGGWVYAEVHRAPSRRGPRSLPGWRRAFAADGLEEVAAHWHAPRITSATRIVSLDASTAVRHALAHHQGGPLGGLRRALATALLPVGLLPLAIPEGSVIGRRPTSPA